MLWLGVLTLLSLLFTASISVMNKKGIKKIPFEWHSRMAIVTIVLGLIHAALAFLAYL
ncbi:TPA: hypothetical protein HA265_07720 [Candidatus Woesearchaeota archaeon]|nr:hypothetical protein [Candidatus Woesearchaeota archaeon]